MTRDAKCPEVPQIVRIHRPLEEPDRTQVIDLAGGRCDRFTAQAAAAPVPFDNERPEVTHARSSLVPRPAGRGRKFFPLHYLMGRVRIGFEEALGVTQGGEA